MNKSEDALNGEGVAALEIAALDAATKPAHALFGAAMGESFGDDVSLGAFLQRVVADLRRGIQPFLDIAFFENFVFTIGEARPNAGEAIGLQLNTDGQRIGVPFARAALTRLHFLHDAQQILHVVADFVSDHIGLCEVAGRLKALAQLAVKGEIDVNFLSLGQ